MEYLKIPEHKVPSIQKYEINRLDEEIVSLRKNGFIVESQYYIQGIKGSYRDCYARKTVVAMLKEAESYLPNDYKFIILDAYRPICIQQILWDSYHKQLRDKYPQLSDEEIDYKTSFFVSKPSYNIKYPSLHNTGGAVDLTICDKSGKWLNMGTDFDDFSDRAWTNHFEKYEEDVEVKNNRRLLYNSMIKAGFTNLPSEWWHYDYGNKFWAYFTGNTALYEGILNIDFKEDKTK